MNPDLHKKLLSGQPLYFGGNEPEKERLIEAEWLGEAARKPAKIDVRRAVIRGTLNLQYVTFEEEVSLIGCDIEERADFSYTNFKRNLILSGTTFHQGANFDSANLEYDALLQGTQFLAGEATFLDLHVHGVFDAQSVYFGDGVKAHFNRARFDKTAYFLNAIFEGETNFISAQIGGQANFTGARLNSKDKPASFSNAKIASHAMFENSRFEGEANFNAVQIGGQADFEDARFKSKDKPASFNSAKFDGPAIFENTRFEGEANFVVAQFIGLAQFSASEGLPASPNQPSSPPEAGGTVFNEVSFEHARFEHDARFDDVVFQGETSFRETSFRAVYFSPKGLAQGKKQFQGGVDLRGCVYERIEVDRKLLLERLRLAPYDRQPYTQLERVFRAVGQDRKADEVYLERRRVEHRRLSIRHEPLRWFGDGVYKWVARYGVRPYRLIVISLILPVIGAFVFSRPLAVEMKSEKQPAELAQSKAPIRNNTDASTQRREVFTGWDALRLSIRLFLPVEVPLATRWKPSDKPFGLLRFSDYATLLKLAGWVLVPLGIAALTGLLRRVAP